MLTSAVDPAAQEAACDMMYSVRLVLAAVIFATAAAPPACTSLAIGSTYK
jgi:hypothetical protein